MLHSHGNGFQAPPFVIAVYGLKGQHHLSKVIYSESYISCQYSIWPEFSFSHENCVFVQATYAKWIHILTVWLFKSYNLWYISFKLFFFFLIFSSTNSSLSQLIRFHEQINQENKLYNEFFSGLLHLFLICCGESDFGGKHIFLQS